MDSKAKDGLAEPKNASPKHSLDGKKNATDGVSPKTNLGEIAGATGGMGSVKIMSASSTLRSHDAIGGEASAGGENAKKHKSPESCEVASTAS